MRLLDDCGFQVLKFRFQVLLPDSLLAVQDVEQDHDLLLPVVFLGREEGINLVHEVAVGVVSSCDIAS